jgi:hypothetical protein
MGPYVAAGLAGFRTRCRLGAAFMAGFAIVLAAIDVVCRFGGLSYFSMLRQVSTTIVQGAYDEGWIVLPRYDVGQR